MRQNADHFRLGPAALVDVTFTISPGHEVVCIVRALLKAWNRPLHRAVLAAISARTPATELALLTALVGRRGYIPDILVQPQASEPADAVEGIRATPSDRMAAELLLALREGGGDKAVIRRLLDDPSAATAALATAWSTFWDAAIGPLWPQCRTLLQEEIRHRSHQLASQGLRAVIDGLHPTLSWTGDGIRRHPSTWGVDVDCEGRGLTLAPSIFSWPSVNIGSDLPWRPTIYYTARNADRLEATPESPGLDRLMGATRAGILRQLSWPATTTEIADAHGISMGTASHHLAILRQSGLIATERLGNHAWHTRTSRGDVLLGTGARA